MGSANVRMPDKLQEQLKVWAKEENRSVNDLTVEILDQAVGRWAALRAIEEARRLRDEIRASRGTLEDSTLLIRELRRERSERV
jgi:hypothetical protein